jgi:hypothetical protein
VKFLSFEEFTDGGPVFFSWEDGRIGPCRRSMEAKRREQRKSQKKFQKKSAGQQHRSEFGVKSSE